MAGLLDMKMTPQIEAYQDDLVGWYPQNPRQAQDYYSIINYMRSLPPEMQPSTDDEIYQFMQAYGNALSDYSGYIPQPQNVARYNQTRNLNGSTDSEIYNELTKLVGPALGYGLLGGR